MVGAGYTGLSAALELAKRGAAVVVLETHVVGWGASSRNGGFALTGFKLGPRELAARYGVRAAARLDALALSAIERVEQLVKDEAIDCAFARCGHLALAAKPQHFEGFQRDADFIAREFGREVQLITRGTLGEEIGSDAYFGGLVDAVSAVLDPARYVRCLARAARLAGATICERAEVVDIERGAKSGEPRKRVISSRGAISVRDVIVATGAYTGRAFPELRRRVIPIGSYIVATAPLTETTALAISPRNRVMYDSRHFLNYFRLTPDMRLLFGGRASFVPESDRATRASAEILQREMLRVYPQLRGVEVTHAWGGTIDFSFDMLPHAIQLDGVRYVAGYGGHGVALATYLGTQVARAVSGEQFEDGPIAGFPTAPLGLYDGNAWFLPAAAAWYRLLDIVS